MFARPSLVMLAVVGSFALGLTVGPQINANRIDPARAPGDVEPTPLVPEVENTPAAAAIPAPVPRLERVPPATAPAVQQQARRLLSDGADVRKAASGFHNAREFMTVAYAARNTEIPFVLLKHRVLVERMPLGRAIHESRPALNQAAEVARARAEAKADLARMAS